MGKRIFIALALIGVLAAIIGGLIELGSPMQARLRRLDDRRVIDLQLIAASVDFFWTRHKRLPTSLMELSKEPGMVLISIRDPQTGRQYEYRILGGDKYQLCAHFALDSGKEGQEISFWSHGSGRWCYRLEAHKAAPP